MCWEFNIYSLTEFSQFFNEIDSSLILHKAKLTQLDLTSGLKDFRIHVLYCL